MIKALDLTKACLIALYFILAAVVSYRMACDGYAFEAVKCWIISSVFIIWLLEIFKE